MMYKILLIGIFCTLCESAVLNNPNRNGEIPEENEPKNPRIPYNFEYDSRDKNGTSLFRKETSDGAGKVEGRYGYKDMFGIERIVEYIADENGYRAKIQTNEPGIENRNPAGVEFYTDFSNRNGQELRRNSDNAVEATTKPETTEEEKTNLVAEKVDALINNQYSGVVHRHPSSPKSQHYLFPQKQDQHLNQYVSLRLAEPHQQTGKSSLQLEERSIPEEFRYAQAVPAAFEGKQQIEIINTQVPMVQYVSPKHQHEGGNVHRQLIAIPLNQYYEPQNQQSSPIQNTELSTTTEAQQISSQAIQPQVQHYYVLPNQPKSQSQEDTVSAIPLSYGHTSLESQKYTPLDKHIRSLSEYYQ